MPFAESGFGDGLTCLSCGQSARVWRHEIEDGNLVVLFDTDIDRENRTSPGGLWAYGKLAALSAGHTDRFLDFYALLTNFDVEPPRAGPIMLQPPEDVTSAIAERIESATPRAIVWWFSQPNAWERTLVDALVAAGSISADPGLPSTALRDRPSALGAHAVRVETPWERRADALRALRTLLVAEPVRPCVRLEVVTGRDYEQPLAITPLQLGDQPPDWVIAGWHEVRVGTASMPVVEAIGLDTSHGASGELVIHVVDFWGTVSTWVGAERQTEGRVAPRLVPVGRSCAVRQRGEWWIADPVAGTLAPAGRSVDVPLAGVVGVAPHWGDLLVATADQRLHVVDPERGEVRRSFAATIVPSRRTHYGECAMLATGDGWIASLDQMRGLLSVYDETGRPLGRLPLAQHPRHVVSPAAGHPRHGRPARSRARPGRDHDPSRAGAGVRRRRALTSPGRHRCSSTSSRLSAADRARRSSRRRSSATGTVRSPFSPSRLSDRSGNGSRRRSIARTVARTGPNGRDTKRTDLPSRSAIACRKPLIVGGSGSATLKAPVSPRSTMRATASHTSSTCTVWSGWTPPPNRGTTPRRCMLSRSCWNKPVAVAADDQARPNDGVARRVEQRLQRMLAASVVVGRIRRGRDSRDEDQVRHAGAARRLDEATGPLLVHPSRPRQIGLACGVGAVHDGVRAHECRLVDGVREIAERGAHPRRRGEARRIAHQGAHRPPAGHQGPAQRAAQEPRCARDRHRLHRIRSATIAPTRSALAMMLNVSPFGGNQGNTEPSAR